MSGIIELLLLDRSRSMNPLRGTHQEIAAELGCSPDLVRRSLIAAGIIDPAKVTRLALQNAGSIASLILTVDCLIANAPKKEAPAGHGMGEQADMY